MNGRPPGGSGLVEPLGDGRHAPDERVLKAIVAAVETTLERRVTTASRKPAYRLWRFSGRSWGGPAPLFRSRPQH